MIGPYAAHIVSCLFLAVQASDDDLVFEDGVAEIVLEKDAPVLEGIGLSRDVEYEVAFEGTLFLSVMAGSNVDPYLRVEDVDGEVLAKDDDSGGGKHACVKRTVKGGEILAIHVAVKGAAPASVRFKVFEARETEATRAAAQKCRYVPRDVERLVAAGAQREARALLATALDEILAVPGKATSAAIAEAVWTLYDEAYTRLDDLPTAHKAVRSVHDFREQALPDHHPDLQLARSSLAVALKGLGDLRAARALEERVLEADLRTLPDDHPYLQTSRGNLADTLRTLGELNAARALEEKVLAVRSRILSDDHSDLQMARGNLAATLKAIGELHAARALEEKVLAVRLRTLPTEHPALLSAQANLAGTLFALGERDAARALQEQVLEVRARTLPDDHPELLAARGNLASSLKELGDLLTARVLEENVLEARLRTLPEDHPFLQVARMNLANTLYELGDLNASRSLLQKALEVYSRTLADDHPELQRARSSLALALRQLGEPLAARTLMEKVLAVSNLPDDHPDRQYARGNLALAQQDLGDLPAARALWEKVVEVCLRALPDRHDLLQLARGNLAATLRELGDLPAARTLLEQVLDFQIRSLPDHDPYLQWTRQLLADVRTRSGGSAEDLTTAITRGTIQALEDPALTLAPREREVHALVRQKELSWPLSWSLAFASPGLAQSLFRAVETARLAAPSRERLVRRVHIADQDRARLQAIDQDLQRVAPAVRRTTFELEQRATNDQRIYFERINEKDRLERERSTILARLAKQQGIANATDHASIARALKPGEAAVGFWLYQRQEIEPMTGHIARPVASYLAWIVKPDASLDRVELGAALPIEQAISAWREAVLAGAERRTRDIVAVEPERASAANHASNATARGEALRALVLAPLLPHLDGVERVIVALDDALHLVPLGALPLADGVVADHLAIVVRNTLKEMTVESGPALHPPSLLAMGGIDYGAAAASGLTAAGDATDPTQPRSAGVPGLGSGAVVATVRAGTRKLGFAAIAGTQGEVATIAELFAKSFENAPAAQVLLEGHATRGTLERMASQVRFLHLATHGYFAPESVPSTEDVTVVDEKFGFEVSGPHLDEVRGFLPLELCGLAFAGANLAPDAYGVLNGVMTAQQLSELDLRGCELVVLSACDTNVGVRRAGQGIASLQQAIYAAGARASLTSLWKIPDLATRELMSEFYRQWWQLKKTKQEALCSAQRMLREQKDDAGQPRYPVRDWAGWVLAGE